MTKPMRAYKTVAMYRTADGLVHVSEKDAQEHVEDAVGKALSDLLHAADPNLGAQTCYRIVCHMLTKHQVYGDVLKALHCFEPPEEDE